MHLSIPSERRQSRCYRPRFSYKLAAALWVAYCTRKEGESYPEGAWGSKIPRSKIMSNLSKQMEEETGSLCLTVIASCTGYRECHLNQLHFLSCASGIRQQDQATGSCRRRIQLSIEQTKGSCEHTLKLQDLSFQISQDWSSGWWKEPYATRKV